MSQWGEREAVPVDIARIHFGVDLASVQVGGSNGERCKNGSGWSLGRTESYLENAARTWTLEGSTGVMHGINLLCLNKLRKAQRAHLHFRFLLNDRLAVRCVALLKLMSSAFRVKSTTAVVEQLTNSSIPLLEDQTQAFLASRAAGTAPRPITLPRICPNLYIR